jgi:hypothetical protein
MMKSTTRKLMVGRSKVAALMLATTTLIATAGAVGLGSPTADASNLGDRLTRGRVLGQGDSITSRNGNYKLVYQSDGNLVIYCPLRAIWASNTETNRVGGFGPDDAELQYDGNFVVYGMIHHLSFTGPSWDERKPLWATGTHAGDTLIMQDDGNLVLYSVKSGVNTVSWASNTANPSGCATRSGGV